MKWILGLCAAAVIFGIAATMTIPAQTITPDQATLKLFPPETTGVAVVDVGGLRGSQLFKDLRPEANYPRGLREFIEATGFDPQRDVEQVTAAKIGPKEFVVIVRANYDRFKVEEFVKNHEIAIDSYLGRTLYLPRQENQADAQMTVSFIDNLIVGGNNAAVKQVIDRLAAPARSALDNETLMAGIRGIEVGNQVWAVGEFSLDSIPEAAKIPAPALQFVRNFTGGSYQMRLDTGVNLKAVGNFTTDETARQTADVLRGLIAVARLQFSQEQDMLRLLDGVRIEYLRNTMTVRFEGDGELLKKLQPRRRGVTAE